MIFDHTRKVTHDLLLLIRESIASFFFFFFFYIYPFTFINSMIISFERRFFVYIKQWIYCRLLWIPHIYFAVEGINVPASLCKRKIYISKFHLLLLVLFKIDYKTFYTKILYFYFYILSYKFYNYVYDWRYALTFFYKYYYNLLSSLFLMFFIIMPWLIKILNIIRWVLKIILIEIKIHTNNM